MPRNGKSPARFVTALFYADGVLWLSCMEDCTGGRGTIQRLLRDGRLSEAGVRDLPRSLLVSFRRPVSDCLEVHVDFTRGVVRDVRAKWSGEELVGEEIVGVQFIDEFSRRVERVYSETGNDGDVRP